MPPPPATRAGTNSNRTAAADGQEIRQGLKSPPRGLRSPCNWAWLDLKTSLSGHACPTTRVRTRPPDERHLPPSACSSVTIYRSAAGYHSNRTRKEKDPSASLRRRHKSDSRWLSCRDATSAHLISTINPELLEKAPPREFRGGFRSQPATAGIQPPQAGW